VTFGDRGQPLEDGNPRWDDDGAAVFEAKFILPWPFSEERAAEKHMEQLQASLCWPSARWHSNDERRGFAVGDIAFNEETRLDESWRRRRTPGQGRCRSRPIVPPGMRRSSET